MMSFFLCLLLCDIYHLDPAQCPTANKLNHIRDLYRNVTSINNNNSI